MKTLVAIIAVICAGYYVYSRPAPAAPRPERQMAPRGTYYLLNYFSTRTPSGLVGWTPGQEVRLDSSVSTGVGYSAVTDGQHTVRVPRSLLTRDVAQAEALRNNDDDAQARAAVVTATVSIEGNAQQLAVNLVHAHGVELASAISKASSMIGTYNSRLNHSAYAASGYNGGGYTSFYNDYNYYPSPYDSVAGSGYFLPTASTASGSSTDASAPHRSTLPSFIGVQQPGTSRAAHETVTPVSRPFSIKEPNFMARERAAVNDIHE